MAANGTALDAGQAALVRQMCTSGARLQLAIAPAGAEAADVAATGAGAAVGATMAAFTSVSSRATTV
jgi:hypothetical protein